MSPVKSKTKKAIISKKAAKTPAGLELAVFNQEGKEVAKINLPANIFGLRFNPSLVKQAYEAQMSQARIPYAHAKDRSEVRGGGKKPWRQKGTGRSRHGSIRSPIWRGGGATFGPRKDTVFAKNINKKMRRSALLMVLSGKARDNEIVVLDDLKLEQPKTKLMANVVKKLNDVKNDLGKGALVVMADKNENIIRATRNIPKFMTIGAQNLNIVDLLNHRYVLMPKSAIEIIERTFAK
jgi:large subunit ribosomal protein L4